MLLSLLLTEAESSDGKVEREGKAGHGERNRRENYVNKDVEKAGTNKAYPSKAYASSQGECYNMKNLILV